MYGWTCACTATGYTRACINDPRQKVLLSRVGAFGLKIHIFNQQSYFDLDRNTSAILLESKMELYKLEIHAEIDIKFHLIFET